MTILLSIIIAGEKKKGGGRREDEMRKMRRRKERVRESDIKVRDCIAPLSTGPSKRGIRERSINNDSMSPECVATVNVIKQPLSNNNTCGKKTLSISLSLYQAVPKRLPVHRDNLLRGKQLLYRLNPL